MEQLLSTKLFIPTVRPTLVHRPRLIEKLNTGITGKLTLISAPAGFGKSTLLCSWTAQMELARIAWLSLDEGDNDLARFFAYFIAALQAVNPDLGKGLVTSIQSLDDDNLKANLIALINEIAASQDKTILVLDDYHVIETPIIDQALTFLIEHLPPQLHLVIASRIDPTLPLARLRTRGEMIEIRVNDLRFTLEETTDFLNHLKGFNLSTQDVSALGKRTEGWIAGLQLAALSIQGLDNRQEISAFVNRFAGSDRYIQDYLVDEVLRQQPQEIKEFLLKTSILERLSGPLCDRLRFGLDDPHSTPSQQILENLETANLFIIPLDNERRWYRYHHLFADLLRHRLSETFPGQIQKLHYWASHWFQRDDFYDEAIQHAQAADDKDQLASILEEGWYIYVHRGEMPKLLTLMDSLGLEITGKNAALSMAYAWSHYLRNSLDQVPPHLENIRALVGDGKMTTYLDQLTQYAVIPSMFASLETALALEKNDIENARNHAERAVSLVPDTPDPRFSLLIRAGARHKLAETYLALKETDQACKILLEVLEMLKKGDDYYGVSNILNQIVSVKRQNNQIDEAYEICRDTARFIDEHQWDKMPTSGIVYLILAGLQAETGNIDSARKNLERGQNLIPPIKSKRILALVAQTEEKLARKAPTSQPLVEPLTPRELEVLQLIAEGHSNREIGEQLYLALDTIKGYNRNIFRKLGVRKRIEAVTKARELGIL